MSPLELDGAPDQESMNPWRKWGPRSSFNGAFLEAVGPQELDGRQIKNKWDAFADHGVPLETIGPIWRPLRIQELAGVPA